MVSVSSRAVQILIQSEQIDWFGKYCKHAKRVAIQHLSGFSRFWINIFHRCVLGIISYPYYGDENFSHRCHTQRFSARDRSTELNYRLLRCRAQYSNLLFPYSNFLCIWLCNSMHIKQPHKQSSSFLWIQYWNEVIAIRTMLAIEWRVFTLIRWSSFKCHSFCVIFDVFTIDPNSFQSHFSHFYSDITCSEANISQKIIINSKESNINQRLRTSFIIAQNKSARRTPFVQDN